MIRVRELSKHFKVPVRKEGRFAAVRNLFSLKRTSKVAAGPSRITGAVSVSVFQAGSS